MKVTSASHHYAVIVAGGSGTRLWPISRQKLPKQMQRFISDKTLIEETLHRLVGLLPIEHIYVSTTKNLAMRIRQILPSLPKGNCIVEPTARGTAAAFALFSSTIYQKDPEAIVFTLASDSAVTAVDRFRQTVAASFAYVESHPQDIVLVGIKPHSPDTGLGYIEVGEPISKSPPMHRVKGFIEKPNETQAKKFLKTGRYFWNAAYYCYKISTFLEAYHDCCPEVIFPVKRYMVSRDEADYLKAKKGVQEIEVIATRYPLVLLPSNFDWSDIGTWHALHQLLARIEGKDLVTRGKHIDIESKNSLIFSTEDKLMATIGLEDMVVVDTKDVLLVMRKGKSKELKDLIHQLQQNDMSEYI